MRGIHDIRVQIQMSIQVICVGLVWQNQYAELARCFWDCVQRFKVMKIAEGDVLRSLLLLLLFLLAPLAVILQSAT